MNLSENIDSPQSDASIENKVEQFRNRLKIVIAFFADGKISKLSELTGINYQTINNWVKKESSLPGAEHIIRICSSIKINERWLISGKGPSSVEGIITRTGLANLFEELESLNPDYVKDNFSKWFETALAAKIEKIIENKPKGLAPVIEKIKQESEKYVIYCGMWLMAVTEYNETIKKIETLNKYASANKPLKYFNLSVRDRHLQLVAEKIETQSHKYLSDMKQCFSNIKLLLEVIEGE